MFASIVRTTSTVTSKYFKAATLTTYTPVTQEFDCKCPRCVGGCGHMLNQDEMAVMASSAHSQWAGYLPAKGRKEIHIRETSMGPVEIILSDTGVRSVLFKNNTPALTTSSTSKSKSKEPSSSAETLSASTDNPLLDEVVRVIEDPTRPHDIPFSLKPGATEFQKTVWKGLRSIPPGTTLSYTQLAAKIGREGASRAVGSACGSNEIAVLIPCHRVIRGDGGLGGYRWGLERKTKLLKMEKEGATGVTLKA